MTTAVLSNSPANMVARKILQPRPMPLHTEGSTGGSTAAHALLQSTAPAAVSTWDDLLHAAEPLSAAPLNDEIESRMRHMEEVMGALVWPTAVQVSPATQTHNKRGGQGRFGILMRLPRCVLLRQAADADLDASFESHVVIDEFVRPSRRHPNKHAPPPPPPPHSLPHQQHAATVAASSIAVAPVIAVPTPALLATQAQRDKEEAALLTATRMGNLMPLRALLLEVNGLRSDFLRIASSYAAERDLRCSLQKTLGMSLTSPPCSPRTALQQQKALQTAATAASTRMVTKQHRPGSNLSSGGGNTNTTNNGDKVFLPDPSSSPSPPSQPHSAQHQRIHTFPTMSPSISAPSLIAQLDSNADVPSSPSINALSSAKNGHGLALLRAKAKAKAEAAQHQQQQQQQQSQQNGVFDGDEKQPAAATATASASSSQYPSPALGYRPRLNGNGDQANSYEASSDNNNNNSSNNNSAARARRNRRYQAMADSPRSSATRALHISNGDGTDNNNDDGSNASSSSSSRKSKRSANKKKSKHRSVIPGPWRPRVGSYDESAQDPQQLPLQLPHLHNTNNGGSSSNRTTAGLEADSYSDLSVASSSSSAAAAAAAAAHVHTSKLRKNRRSRRGSARDPRDVDASEDSPRHQPRAHPQYRSSSVAPTAAAPSAGSAGGHASSSSSSSSSFSSRVAPSVSVSAPVSSVFLTSPLLHSTHSSLPRLPHHHIQRQQQQQQQQQQQANQRSNNGGAINGGTIYGSSSSQAGVSLIGSGIALPSRSTPPSSTAVAAADRRAFSPSRLQAPIDHASRH